jgi:iron complex outermembrane receptor protein
MRTLASSATWGAKVEAGLALPVALVIGADFYARRWDNVTTRLARSAPGTPYLDERSIPDVSILDGGVYAEARRELAGVRASAGLRLDVARTDAGVDRSDLYRVFHPADRVTLRRDDVLVAGNVQAERDLRGGVTVFAGYGHGARVPDPQERYLALSGMAGNADWLGDPGLAPPRSDEVDAGVRFAASRLLLDAQVFHAWLADHVALASREVTSGSGTRRAKTYANVDARTFGYEVSGRVALPLDLFLGAAAAFTRGENESDGVPLAETPPFHATATLRWDDGAFFAEAEEAFAARQDRVDARVGEGPTPSHWTTSLRVGATWRGTKLFAGVRNVFDAHYVEHLAYLRDPFASGVRVPEPGRTLYVNAQYAF